MKEENYYLIIIGIIPVIWLALLIAPFTDGNLIEIITNLETAIKKPFNIELCENSLATIFFFILFYLFGITLYFSNKKNYRRNKEHGSAKWGNGREVNKK